mgnify:FL=1
MKSSSKKPTLLLVDDDPMVFEIIGQELESEFYIIYANDGQEALAILSRVIPTIMIFDVVMPNVSGIELAKKVKMNTALSSVPFLFLSNITSTEEVHEALGLGPMAFINKPIDIKALRKTINELMI